jgi:hypothetical protein
VHLHVLCPQSEHFLWSHLHLLCPHFEHFLWSHLHLLCPHFEHFLSNFNLSSQGITLFYESEINWIGQTQLINIQFLKIRNIFKSMTIYKILQNFNLLVSPLSRQCEIAHHSLLGGVFFMGKIRKTYSMSSNYRPSTAQGQRDYCFTVIEASVHAQAVP